MQKDLMNKNKELAALAYNTYDSTEDSVAHGATAEYKNQFIAFLCTRAGVFMQFKIKLGEGKLSICTMQKLIEKKVIDLTDMHAKAMPCTTLGVACLGASEYEEAKGADP